MDKNAFSLAETLITLVVIGIVAALTIPNLMRKYEDQQTITGVKTAYAILDNALKMMYREEGNPQDWIWPETSALKGELFMNKLSNYLKVEKYCGNTNGCFNYGHDKKYNNHGFKTIDGLHGEWGTWNEHLRYGKMILKNGMHISMSDVPLDKNGIGNILVDINGPKGPNQYGYDTFFFNIDYEGISRTKKAGVSELDTNGVAFGTNFCYKKNTWSATHYRGISCAFWIMRHGNVDYKYRDVRSEWW